MPMPAANLAQPRPAPTGHSARLERPPAGTAHTESRAHNPASFAGVVQRPARFSTDECVGGDVDRYSSTNAPAHHRVKKHRSVHAVQPLARLPSPLAPAVTATGEARCRAAVLAATAATAPGWPTAAGCPPGPAYARSMRCCGLSAHAIVALWSPTAVAVWGPAPPSAIAAPAPFAVALWHAAVPPVMRSSPPHPRLSVALHAARPAPWRAVATARSGSAHPPVFVAKGPSPAHHDAAAVAIHHAAGWPAVAHARVFRG